MKIIVYIVAPTSRIESGNRKRGKNRELHKLKQTIKINKKNRTKVRKV